MKAKNRRNMTDEKFPRIPYKRHHVLFPFRVQRDRRLFTSEPHSTTKYFNLSEESLIGSTTKTVGTVISTSSLLITALLFSIPDLRLRFSCAVI